MRKLTVVLVVLAVTMAVQPVHASGDTNATTSCRNGVTETVNYSDSVFDVEMEYHFTFDESRELLCVQVENVGNNPESGGYNVIVDNTGLDIPRPELAPGETLSATHNVTPWLRLFEDNHTIGVGARGENVRFNFTSKRNASAPDVPSPEIRDVEVVRNERNGSTVLQVSLFNPTVRGYAFYVQAETFGTGGVSRIGAPQENQTQQVLLPLEESPDEVVAGKVRIFQNWDELNGKYDQKEFLSKPNESTDSWDVSFERVPAITDQQSYTNESAAQYREGYVDDKALTPRQRNAGAVGVALLAVGGGWAWRRRRRR